MDPKANSKTIPNKVTAKAVHTKMRANGASPYELGLFYKALLRRGLWSSKSHLAESLGVSVSNVSKVVALTRIPAEVIDAIGGAKHISFRTGALLLDAIDQIGETVFIARVREAARLNCVSVDDILEFAVFDRIPEGTPNRVRVRLARDNKSLRVEIADLDRLLPHLLRLEMFISTSFILFEAGLAGDAAVSAASARRRLRKAT
jgi:hypothetical protein